MKPFTTAEIRDLFGQVVVGEISFSRMAEIMNDRVNEKNEPQYKDGDFVVNKAGSILIFKEKVGDSIYDHAYLTKNLMLFTNSATTSCYGIKRYATEAEKQKLLDVLAKKGKRWNAEKLCVEDIPAELKKGDLAIFWDSNKEEAFIGIYKQFLMGVIFQHKDHRGNLWKNAIKFESKEQYRKLLNGEI